MSNARLIRTLSDSERMHCPRSMGMPLDPAHAAVVGTLDRFDGAIEKNGDGEFVSPEAETAYTAAAYGGNDRMWLMADGVNVMDGGRLLDVQTWWWECRICGCILPATSVAVFGAGS